MNSFLEFEYSPWFILLCIALGIAYSIIQYDKKVPWSLEVNRLLSLLRVLVVTMLAILILGPMIRAITNYYEKPIFALAIDNSQSISMAVDSLDLLTIKSEFKNLSGHLINNGWETVLFDINGIKSDLDSLSFNESRSNLTSMVRSIQSEYEGGNLAGILLVSDGIFNSGYSPDLISNFTPIYTLGLGDTVQKSDLSIIDVKHNQTAYQDNIFPVEVSIKNNGIGPARSILRIYEGNLLKSQKTIEFTPENRLVQHLFEIEANEPGKQRINIYLEPVENESTIINNQYSFYIDVVEGQQKVLIIADAPIPDVKAIRLAIEKKENFDVELYEGDQINLKSFDLVVFLQVPNSNKSINLYQDILEAEIPQLFFVGSLTNISQLKNAGLFNINQVRNQYDQVSVGLNNDFTGFTLSEEINDWIADVPPLLVPFGDIILPPNNQVVLYQKVGSIVTNKPVLYFAEESTRYGVVIGDGLWKWRLNEYYRYGETVRFDELITKTVMYLAAKPDNRQFKLYPVKDEYEVGQNIKFAAETYNELFEPVYGEQVTIRLSKGEDLNTYTFTPLDGSTEVSVGILEDGIYNYEGYTVINGVRHAASGQFTVDNPNIEASELTADFTTLKNLSLVSDGKFYTMNQMNRLINELKSLEAPSIIHTREKEVLLLNLPWILILIILLVSGEWLVRKMMGGY